MKEHLCWDAQLWGYSLFSMYLQRCMNIWLMSHGLWRNLITVLLYKGSSFTVNTAANSVTDTGALSASNMCWGVNSFPTRESMAHIILLSVLNCCRLNLQTLICKDFSNGNKQWHVSQKAAVSPGPELLGGSVQKQSYFKNSVYKMQKGQWVKIFMESRVLQQILTASKSVFSGISGVVQGCNSQHGQRFCPPTTPDQKCSSFLLSSFPRIILC